MQKGSVKYYLSRSGENPVKDFLNSISKREKAKVFRIFMNIQEYGLSVVIPHIKKLTGSPLWEIRILGNDNIRLLYVVIDKDGILVLHGFIKKSQKTPHREIYIATSRYQQFLLD